MSATGGIDFNIDQTGQVSDPNDKCIPIFMWQPKYMRVDSENAGHPIYVQEPFVKVLIPGNSKDIPILKVTDEHKRRWPRQWLLFEKMGENPASGIPIEQWPALNVAQVAMLKSLNILSIENLANLDDAYLVKIGPEGRNLRQRAQTYLKQAADSALADKYLARIAELESQVRELLSKQGTNIVQLEKPMNKDGSAPKKRGRKPKEPA